MAGFWGAVVALMAQASVARGAILYTGLTSGTSAASTRGGGAWTRVASADIPVVSPYAAPALADLDGDGDRDALVGEEKGQVRAWRNDGTDAAPRWVRSTPWDTGRYGNRSTPALADLDGDGDADLLVGEASGAVIARENVGGRGAPVWKARVAWNLDDLGNDSRPAFGDVDRDGTPDLLVGYGSGTVLAFASTGDAAAPLVRHAAWDPPAVSGRATPVLGDLDGDGAADLLVVDQFARFAAYRNVAGAWLPQAAWAPPDPGSGPLGLALVPGTLDGSAPPPGNAKPVARLTATPASGAPPLAVRLDAGASSDADGDALAFTWDFGDGLAAGPVDPDPVLRGMDAAYDAAKAARDADRFADAIDGYLACVTRLMPLTTITSTGPLTKQGTNRVDRVARWYLQKIAHDLGAIYLFNSLGMPACPRFTLAVQFSREAAVQAVAGGFPSLPDLNGTTANIADATARLVGGACTVPPYEPMFTTPPQTGGPVVTHTYATAGSYSARVTVGDGTDTAAVSSTITVGTTTPSTTPPTTIPNAGAEPLQGFGATTPGGAGGRTIPIRTPTEAAVRAALEQANGGGKAIVVFETTGPIEITHPLPALTAPFVTIEGKGATLYGPRIGAVAPMVEIRSHDVIVRDLRLRNAGDNIRLEGNGAWNVVLSHLSSTGAMDDGISIGYGAHDVTVQHCFLAGNTRSIFMKYGKTTNVSLHDTWIMKQWMRGPLISQSVVADIRNVILEDWTMWGLRFEKGASGNVVNSIFRLSPYADGIGGKANSALRVNGRPVYTAGNLMQGRVSELDSGTLTAPLLAPATSMRPAAQAEAAIEAGAGAMPRDAVDQQYIDTTTGWSVRGSRPFRLGPGA